MSTEPDSRISTYTVAWIFALSIEAVACIGMLDERHPFLPTAYSDDTNSYILGKIRGHNVVITSSSLALFSYAAFATLVTDTLRTFPEVGICFSLGLGGGAGNKSHDIRLGDVVVSAPDTKDGALAHIDLAGGSRYRAMELPPRLPEVTVKAMLKLRSRHELEEPALSSYPAVLQDSQPMFRPPLGQADRLFCAGYHHEGEVNDCSSCDPAQVVRRPSRQDLDGPAIHYSRIASVNKVVKNGELRDRLALENDILCFETEAAGLPSPVPCLILRGISDYTDSHQNSLWQGAAAAAAAAYAKELLSVIHPNGIHAPLLGRDNINSTAREVSTADRLFSVRRERNAHFAGREDILSHLRKSLYQERCVCLVGLAGIGKTEIALEYAYRLKTQDPEVHIVWISATSTEQFMKDVLELAKKSRLDILGARDFDVLEAVLSWLREETGKWFLVLDDFDERNLDPGFQEISQQVNRLLSISAGTRGTSLITTRERHHELETHVYIIMVTELAVADAVLLLRSFLGAKSSDRDLELFAISLVTKLGCLPLAIVQAATFMKSRPMSVHDYLKTFDEHSKIFDRQRTSFDWQLPGPGPEGALSKILNSVLDRLHKDQPDASDLLSVLAMFKVAEIPSYLLQLPSFENTDLRPEVHGLLRNGLLSFTPDEKSLIIDNAVGSLIRKRLKSEDQEAGFASQALALMVDRFPGVEDQDSEICEALAPPALSILRQKIQPSSWKPKALLLIKVGLFQHDIGKLDQALEMVSDACKILRANGCPNDKPPATLAQEALASILFTRGEYQNATEIYETILEQKRSTLGSDHPETLRISVQVARLYYEQGRLSESGSLLRVALDKISTIFGPEHPQMLSVMNLLASTLSRESKYTEAERLFRQTWHGYKIVMGAEHPDSLASMNNLVSTLIAQDKFLEAQSLAEQALHSFRIVLGEKHPDTLAAMNNLALILGENKRLEEAEDLNKCVLELYERMMGNDHISRLTSLHNLGRIYMLQGRLPESEAVYREELAALERLLGPDDPTTKDCRICLAKVIEDQGRRTVRQDLEVETSKSLSQTRVSDDDASKKVGQSLESLGASLSTKLELDDAPLTLTPEDNLIAVMGVTGSGKSSFIQLFTSEVVGIGSELESCTAQVAIFPCKLPTTRKKFYLLDTPGFDDSNRSDQDILREVASWLTKTFAENVKLSGIIYLHRIADVRFSGSAMNNLRLFQKICGDESMAAVVLATTFWDMVDDAVGQTRVTQLKSAPKYWGGMVERGSRVFRHDAREHSGAAIIQYLLGRREKPVYAIQDEMVNKKKTLEETAAGMQVTRVIEWIRMKYEQTLPELKKDLSQAVKEHDLIAQNEIEQTRKEREAWIQRELEASKRMHVAVDALWQQREAEREKDRLYAYYGLMGVRNMEEQPVYSLEQPESRGALMAKAETTFKLASKRSKVVFRQGEVLGGL